MVIGLDSATPPSAAAVAAARAVGIRVWSGYLASQTTPRQPGKSNNPFKLYNAWYEAEFDIARGCGGMPIAFASGWDDPAACKQLAAAWRVRLCLDVEGGIRGDGPWVQGWVDTAASGLYGTSGVHVNRRAAFHIAAWYVSHDPSASWPASWPQPAAPCGWQWQNTHTEFGVGVDRSWLDDWFGGELMHQSQKFNDVRQWYAVYEHRAVEDGNLTTTEIDGWAKQIADDGSNEDAVQQHFIDGSKLSGNYKLGGSPAPVVPAGTTFTATVK